MPVPSPRNKILPARGNFADLSANIASLLDGEICYAIDQDQYYQIEGGTLVSVGATKAQGLLADSALQPGDNISELNNDAGYLTSAQALGTDLSYTASTRVIASSTGDDATLPEVVAAGDSGLMTGADKTKLDGIEAGAEVNTVNSVAGKTGDVTLDKDDVGLGNVDNTSDADKPVSTATQSALDAKADLVGGVIPNSQLPSLAISEYLGTVADQAAMLALTGQRGDWAIRTDTSTTWVITTDGGSSLSDWTELATPADAVSSVNGYQGAVVLSASDVGAATTAQGALADSAMQPGDNISELTNDSGYITSFDITTETDPKYLRSDTDDTATGNIDFTSTTTPITTNAVKFNNTENDGNSYTDATGVLAFDENFASDSNYGTGTYDPATVFTGGDGGGILIKNQDGWGAVFTSQNTRWATAEWDGLTVDGNRVLTIADEGSGNGLDADTVDGIEASSFLRSDANNNTATGNFVTSSYLIEAGKGSGSVALTINDGYGNANVAFNHALGTPDVNGNALRIKTNVDSTTANAEIVFQGKTNVSADTTVSLNELFKMTESGATCLGNTVWHAGNDGASSGLDADLLDGQEGSYYLDYDNFTNKPTILQPGDRINVPAGTAAAPGLYFDDNTGLYSPGEDQVAISTGGTGRLFVDSSGNVGIGTSDPGAGLHIVSSGQTVSNINTSSNINALVTDDGVVAGNGGSLVFGSRSGQSRFAAIKGLLTSANNNSRGNLAFSTRRTVSDSTLSEAMRIAYDGNVGIGTSDPGAKLHIAGTTTAGGIKIVDSNTGNAAPGIEVIGKRGDANNSVAFAGKLLLSKNRTDAAIQNNNKIGVVAFGGNHTNGSEGNILYSASIYARADGDFNSATDMPTALVFNTGKTGQNSDTVNVDIGTEHMRIDSSGNVGVGTTSPLEKLDIVDTSGVALRLQGANTNRSKWRVRVTDDGSNAFFQIDNFSGGSYNTNVTIDQSGKVGVGTASPSSLLHINGSGSANANISLQNGTTSSQKLVGGVFGVNNVGFSIYDELLGATTFRIDDSGNVGIGTNNPAQPLHVYDDTADVVGRFESGDSIARILLKDNAGSNYISTVGTNLDFSTNGVSTRMRINGDGNVGVGTTSPLEKLDIVDTSGVALRLQGASSDRSKWRVRVTDDGSNGLFQIDDFSGGSYTNNVTITHSGNVGIGTSDPAQKLDVAGNVNLSSGAPILYFNETDASTNNKTWAVTVNNEELRWTARNDAGGGGGNYFALTRSAQQVSTFEGRISSNTWFIIDNPNQNVGIGTSSPGNKLSVAGGDISLISGLNATDAGRSIRFFGAGVDDTSNNFAEIKGGLGSNSTPQLGYLSFKTSGTEQMRINDSGRLLLETSSVLTTKNNTGTSVETKFNVAAEGGVSAGAIYRNARSNNSVYPLVVFDKQRGSISAPSAVINNDYLGALTFTGYDGATQQPGAAIAAQVDGTPGANDMPSRLVFSTTADGESSPTERMRIDSSGTLLAGTQTASGSISAPNHLGTDISASVQVNSSGDNSPSISLNHARGNNLGSPYFAFNKASGDFTTPTIVGSASDIGSLVFNGFDGTNYIRAAQITTEVEGTPGTNDMPGRITFSTTADGASNPTGRMTIRSSGAIDTLTSAGSALQVRNTTTAAGNAILGCVKGATNLGNGTQVFVVRGDGDCENTNNSYGALSDVKLKENIADASPQWDDIKSLQVRKYNFKPETGHDTHTQLGLIAQEVELVSPGLVSESPDRDEEGNDLGTVTKSVNYSVLYMKAVKALQEAMERIEVLEQRLSDAGL